jgi:hypothetical protein
VEVAVGQSPFAPNIPAVFTVAAEIRKGPLNKISGTKQKKIKREVTRDDPFHHDYVSHNSFSEKRLKTRHSKSWLYFHLQENFFCIYIDRYIFYIKYCDGI